MAVTRAQFIARAPGKNFSGVDSTLVTTMLDAADAETSAGGGHDERVHWLTGYKLAGHLGDVPARDVFLAEYQRLCEVEFGGPWTF